MAVGTNRTYSAQATITNQNPGVLRLTNMVFEARAPNELQTDRVPFSPSALDIAAGGSGTAEAEVSFWMGGTWKVRLAAAIPGAQLTSQWQEVLALDPGLQILTLRDGVNAISLRVRPEGVANSRELATWFATKGWTVKEMTRWRSDLDDYESDTPDLPAGFAFPISAEEGYLITLSGSGMTTVYVAGSPLGPMTPPVLLRYHQYLVNSRWFPETAQRAEDLLQYVASLGLTPRALSDWRGLWVPHRYGGAADNFAIDPNKAYFLQMGA